MKENKAQKLKTFAAGLAVGGVLVGGGVYASTVSASNVSYSNSSSGISATNAQGALDSLASSAQELKYLKNYYACHSVRVDKSLFKAQYKTITTVISSSAYGNMIYNLTGDSSKVSSAGSTFNRNIESCCKQSSHCNATSGTCYDKCTSGYDSYFISC